MILLWFRLPRTFPLFPYTTLFRSAWPRRARYSPQLSTVRSIPARGATQHRVELREDVVGGAVLVVAVPAELLREGARRSEEHTSELQSHVNLVCRLLLEKINQ